MNQSVKFVNFILTIFLCHCYCFATSDSDLPKKQSIHTPPSNSPAAFSLTVYEKADTNSKIVDHIKLGENFQYAENPMLQLIIDEKIVGWISKDQLNQYLNLAYRQGYFVSVKGENDLYSVRLTSPNDTSTDDSSAIQTLSSSIEAMQESFFKPFFNNQRSIMQRKLNEKITALEQKVAKLEQQTHTAQ